MPKSEIPIVNSGTNVDQLQDDHVNAIVETLQWGIEYFIKNPPVTTEEEKLFADLVSSENAGRFPVDAAEAIRKVLISLASQPNSSSNGAQSGE